MPQVMMLTTLLIAKCQLQLQDSTPQQLKKTKLQEEALVRKTSQNRKKE